MINTYLAALLDTAYFLAALQDSAYFLAALQDSIFVSCSTTRQHLCILQQCKTVFQYLTVILRHSVAIWRQSVAFYDNPYFPFTITPALNILLAYYRTVNDPGRVLGLRDDGYVRPRPSSLTVTDQLIFILGPLERLNWK